MLINLFDSVAFSELEFNPAIKERFVDLVIEIISEGVCTVVWS